MELRISQTGIRSGEIITSSPSGKQNKGAVMEIRGFYPPDISRVNKTDMIDFRDSFNTIPFFSNMNPNQRKEWLINNGSQDKDVYLEDTDVWVKFVKIGNKNFFTKSLGQDNVDILLRGNPNDEGFWPIRQVYEMFPRKPGSRARKTTLIFRPSNWSLMIPKRLVNSYTGLYINLNQNTLKSGTIKTPVGGKIYSFDLESDAKRYLPKLGVIITDIRNTPLTEETLLKLDSKYVDIKDIKFFKTIVC